MPAARYWLDDGAPHPAYHHAAVFSSPLDGRSKPYSSQLGERNEGLASQATGDAFLLYMCIIFQSWFLGTVDVR